MEEILYGQTEPRNILASNGELIVFQRLCLLKSNVGEKLRIFYSVTVQNLIRSGKRRFLKKREADFLIFDPSRGFIVLEVKGGPVELRNGVWGYNREGSFSPMQKNGDNSDPFEQAEDCSREIYRHFFAKTGRPIPFGSALILPEVGSWRGNLPPNIEKQQLITGEDLINLNARIEDLFKLFSGEDYLDERIAHQFQSYITNVYCDFSFTKGVNVSSVDTALEILTLENLRFILEQDYPRALYYGGPGTGKTTLAKMLVKSYSEQGLKSLLVCFNRPLYEDIKEEFSSLGIRADIYNYHTLALRIAKDAGLKVPSELNRDESFWNEICPSLILEAVERNPRYKYDCIVVDEGQDFSELWFLSIAELLKDSGRIQIFLDLNQGLYRKEFVLPDVLQDLQISSLPLYKNLRNTRQINGEVCKVCWDMVLRPNNIDGEKPIFRSYSSEAGFRKLVLEQVRDLQNVFQLQLKDIVILTPSPFSFPLIESSLRGIPVVESANLPRDKNVLRLATIRSFKGLEAKSVIVAGISSDDQLCSQADLLVAFSRAKLLLTVLHHTSWSPGL